MASKTGRRDIVTSLLAAGAEVNRRDNAGTCALSLSCRSEDGTLTRLLLQHGACRGDDTPEEEERFHARLLARTAGDQEEGRDESAGAHKRDEQDSDEVSLPVKRKHDELGVERTTRAGKRTS